MTDVLSRPSTTGRLSCNLSSHRWVFSQGLQLCLQSSGPDKAWKFIESVACAAQDFCCAFTTGRHLGSTVLSHERGGGTGYGKGLARVPPGCAHSAPPAGPFLGYMEHTAVPANLRVFTHPVPSAGNYTPDTCTAAFTSAQISDRKPVLSFCSPTGGWMQPLLSRHTTLRILPPDPLT